MIKFKNLWIIRNLLKKKIKEIKENFGQGKIIIVLSSGVNNSTVTVLRYRALGNKLKAIFINNGLLRKNEPENVIRIFKNLELKVEIIDTKKKFFRALKVVAGIKFQHNVFDQIGISTQEKFSYRLIEPLIELRKK